MALFDFVLFNVIPILVILGLLALSIKQVRPTDRALVERFGKYRRFVNPGLTFIIPVVDRIFHVNITEQMVDAQKQEVITGDNLNAVVDAQIYFKVLAEETSVKASQYSVDEYSRQIVALARTTLRDIIGKYPFTKVNSERNTLNKVLEKELQHQTIAWGIQVVRTEIKEIEPPDDVQETMNKVLKAENEKIAAKDFATAMETEADGKRRAAIKEADGEKQSRVLVAEGKAEAIKLVNESAQKYFQDQAVPYEQLQASKEIFGKMDKLIVPSDSPLTDIISAVMATKTVTKEKKE